MNGNNLSKINYGIFSMLFGFTFYPVKYSKFPIFHNAFDTYWETLFTFILRYMMKKFILFLMISGLLIGGAKEFDLKVSKVRKFMKRESLTGMLLSTQRNFAWLTDGGTSTVVIASEIGTVSLLVTLKKVYLLAPNDEVRRFMDEELKGLNVEPVVFKWYEDVDSGKKLSLAKKLGGPSLGSDLKLPGIIFIENRFKTLRYVLTPEEIKRYRLVAREAAEAAEAVAREIKRGMSEGEIRALTSYELYKRGLVPTVLLIGVDSGFMKYRHVIPKGRKLKKYAQVNICAKKWGLVVAVTRLVHFGPLPKKIRKRQNVAEKVYAAFMYGLRPGAKVSKVFREAVEVYSKYGYPHEWENHHQGGAIGYNEREYIATLNSKEVVHLNQAFAFNPTLEGAKVEDTVLVTKKGIDVLSYTGNWPYKKVKYKEKTYLVPDILIR